MRRYILRRLVLGIPVIVAVSVLVFILVRLLPGDLAAATLGQSATAERLDAFREQLGLNEPIPQQYARWAGKALTGDLGKSLRSSKPVGTEIKDRLPVTIELAVLAMLFSVLIGVPIGVVSAVKQDTPVDYVIRFISILGLSLPVFWISILIILLSSLWFQWSIPVGYRDPWVDPARNIQQVGIPAVALSLGLSAFIMRILRSSMIEVLRHDYIRTAMSKGLNSRTVIMRHGLKNALVPVVTVLGLQFSLLLGGTAIVELIFSLPGLGRLTLNAIQTRDYPLIQATVLLFGTVFVLMNLLIDLLYCYFDPRVRLS